MTAQMVVESWKKLRHRPRGAASEIPTIATGVESGFGPVRLATGERGQPRLLLPLNQGEAFPRGFDTVGLVLRDVTLTLDGSRRRFIDLICVMEELDSEFADVAAEILERVGGGKSCVAACTSSIADFAALLKAAGDEAVTPEKVVGLVGELTFLQSLLVASPAAWENWQGADADRHDFRSGSMSVEVKTSTRVGSPHVTISSHDQLFEPVGGLLFLRHYCMEKVAGGAITVATLAADIMTRVSSPLKFREKLAAMGCGDPAAAEWNTLRFELQAVSTYRVVEGFPRITRASFPGGVLPVGIDKVRYRLDLSAAAAFVLAPDEEAQFIGMFLACQ